MSIRTKIRFKFFPFPATLLYFLFLAFYEYGTIQKVRNGKGVGGYQHIPLRQAKIASFFPTIKRDKGGRGV